MSPSATSQTSLGDHLTLPCGAVLKNRIVKSAMSDSLGNGYGDATEAQANLYARWARGGAGLSIIGEVQIDCRFPEKPGNLFIDADSDAAALKALAAAGSQNGTALWAQIGHAGALADPDLTVGRGPSTLGQKSSSRSYRPYATASGHVFPLVSNSIPQMVLKVGLVRMSHLRS